MLTHISVISAHPIVQDVLSELLRADAPLRRRLCKTDIGHLGSAHQHAEPHLFVVDESSLDEKLAPICRLLRVRCPGSKFLALLPPEEGTDEDIARLLYLGFDGIILLKSNWRKELLAATRAITNGEAWVPPHIMSKYIKQTSALFQKQGRSAPLLTEREQQVLDHVLRRLSNREISELLGISERTVKYHVSKIFLKLDVKNRDRLFATVGLSVTS